MDELEYQRWRNDQGPKLQVTFNYLALDSVVFDIGFYEGDWTLKIVQQYDCRVFGFEPVPSHFKHVLERFSKYPKVHCFNYGLGGKSRKVTMFLEDDATGIYSTGKKKAEVVIRDIFEVVVDLRLQVALASVNIEGGEYELLERMIEKDLLYRFDHLLIQYHFMTGKNLQRRHAITQVLFNTHIQVYNYPTVWEYWARKGL